MTYPADFESKLGFDTIRQRLSGYCLGGLGVSQVEDIHFITDFEVLRKALGMCLEVKHIRVAGDGFQFHAYADPTEWYPIIGVEGSFLEAAPLQEIASALQLALTIRHFLEKRKETFPLLHDLCDFGSFVTDIPKAIGQKIDESGQVKDHASPELSRVRRRLREEEHQARKLIEQLFRQWISEKAVPEGAQPVVRDGRVVIPVRSEYKRKVKGLIMDESATGQTVYIEPQEVVEANNEIRDLQLEERREIVKVLKALTNNLRVELDAVKGAFYFLGQMDSLLAKVRLADELDGVVPRLMDRPHLDWKSARHPILFLAHKDKSAIIPLTIDLTETDRLLLVSGPNAGGKSVCLKTVGLLQYMLQCGLLVPMGEDSTAGIFDGIYLDIGDQQSIENDLSTYSSHLNNMNFFIQHATQRSLVLLDELGAGTDPNFGGGIAQAILEELVHRRVWGVATTHYYNLKLYASQREGIRNGAMLFDSRQLEPLFMLEIGKPGSSFALEIARKTGLPDKVISSAEAIIGSDLTGLETLIKTVADDKLKLEQRELRFNQREKELESKLQQYESLLEELESKKKEIIFKAKEEAAALLKDTNREIEKTIRHIRENKAEKKETRKVRDKLVDMATKVKPVNASPAKPESLKVGDRVKMRGQEVAGILLSVKGQTAVVQFGDLRSTMKLSQLTKADSSSTSKSSPAARRGGFNMHEAQADFNTTLDVRGMRAEEVQAVLDQFLDRALLLGHGELRILHGKGEGVLRKVIRERLKSHRFVASWADEHVERGGDGITVIVLK